MSLVACNSSRVCFCRILNKYQICVHCHARVLGTSRNTFGLVLPGFDSEGGFDPAALASKRPDSSTSNTIAAEEPDFWAPGDTPKGLEQEQFVHVLSEEVVRNFGEALPHKSLKNTATGERRTQVNIPNGLFSSRANLCDQLKENHRLRSTLGQSTFYKYLSKFFWFVSFRKWTPFSKCDVCVRLKQRWLGSTGSPDQSTVKDELQNHRNTVSMSRLRLAFRALIALAFPTLFLHIIMDGMDSAKTWSPHVTTHSVASKGLSDKGENLKTKLCGVLAEGRWFQGHVTYPHYPEGANVMVTILHHALVKHVNWYNSLPQVLFLQLDNCGRDNKNHTMLAYLAYLVQQNVFTEVYIDFLPVGEI